MKFKKFRFKGNKKIRKKYSAFTDTATSAPELSVKVNRNSKLKKAIKVVFSKKTAATALVATGLGYGIKEIWTYIETNSGCFMKKIDGSVCKIIELSCCQDKPVDNIPNCNGLIIPINACDNYDMNETSCCRKCKCGKDENSVRCAFGEEVHCQKPTIGEALSHFAEDVGSGVLSTIKTIFPWTVYIIYGMGIVFVLWILGFILPILGKIIPRKRNKDA